MKNYKVIKEFASAQKGDMLTYNEDTNLYEFSMTTENDNEKCSRYMCMDEETAEEFVESGNLLVIEDEDKEISAIDKLCALSDLIDTLEAQYKKDHDDIVEAYNNQEIPTCVKVEADTVYFNMNQILKKVKEIINE
ncbi:hypothetical protein [uncultured phage cr19_1]|jgi:hypothetical protein|uniref:Uncharacterized protein n=1 Tax=uncultured phage cr19_1 TaxID=2986420 RepID=A0AAE7V3I4_9CAUD|nr:hypothetical protein OJM11_gp15 [uncultured phage cr19_1]QWM90909.1 hypothetical protein [uncultured phage cr19_1]